MTKRAHITDEELFERCIAQLFAANRTENEETHDALIAEFKETVTECVAVRTGTDAEMLKARIEFVTRFVLELTENVERDVAEKVAQQTR